MTTTINQKVEAAINAATFGNSAFFEAEISDLEILGWDFTRLFDSVAAAQNLSDKKAAKWAKRNLYAVIIVDEDGGTLLDFRTRDRNDYGGSEPTGDDKQTIEDLHTLANAGQITAINA